MYCIVLTLYFSFEPEAEQKCEAYLGQAQQISPETPEVYQLLASVRLSQQRNEEAVSVLQQSMSLWMNKEFGDPAIPIYDSRLSLVRLLLEIGMFEQAFTVLEGLQKENDQVVDLWYLYGWAYYCLGDDEHTSQEERQGHWEDARDCLETAVKVRDWIIIIERRSWTRRKNHGIGNQEEMSERLGGRLLRETKKEKAGITHGK